MTVGDTVFCRDDVATGQVGPRPNQKGRVLRIDKLTITIEFDEPFWNGEGKAIRTWVYSIESDPNQEWLNALDHISALHLATPAIDHLLSFLKDSRTP